MSKAEQDPSILQVVGTSAVILLAIAIGLAVVQGGGWDRIQKYFNQRVSNEKLVVMQFQGEWALGEYRACASYNLPEEDKNPVLECIGGSSTNADKLFKVAFSGAATYESDRPQDTVHYWLCRRDGTDPGFSCTVKEPEAPKKQQAGQHDLGDSDIENLRKRNQCEQRFYDKKIYDIGGMSIGPACKQNPDRLP